MDPDYVKLAIKGVTELLIIQLQKEEFCLARQTGRALEILVNNKGLPMPTPPSQDCGDMIGQRYTTSERG